MYKNILLFVVLVAFFSPSIFANDLSLQVNQTNSSCNFSFDISTENTTFTKTIYYTFQTNSTNYTIEYWIENQNNEAVKSKYNTTNLNLKQFTPEPGNYTIKANLYSKNCILYDQREIFKKPSLEVNPVYLINDTNNTNLNNCNYSLNIQLSKNISEDKIYYKFKTNATNYTIQYWIEDYLGSIVKKQVNTTNQNQKQYTPKSQTNFFYIHARLSTNNCSIHTSKLAPFYSRLTYIDNKDRKSSDSSSKDSNENHNKQSRIEITNIDDIQSGKKKELIYEIYRGDTLKRTAYIYLNNKKIGSAELVKYSKLKGRILLNPKSGKNTISITGLDLEEQFIFYNNKTTEKEEFSQTSKPNFQITNHTIQGPLVNFILESNIKNMTALCYINYIRTKMSNTLNLTQIQNKSNLNLEINNTKLQQKDNLSIYPLKLHCKYKKSNNKYYTYETINLNYTISSQIQALKATQITSKLNQHTLKTPILSTKTNQNIKEEPQKTYSSNHETKENSFFFILIAAIIILSALILKW